MGYKSARGGPDVVQEVKNKSILHSKGCQRNTSSAHKNTQQVTLESAGGRGKSMIKRKKFIHWVVQFKILQDEGEQYWINIMDLGTPVKRVIGIKVYYNKMGTNEGKITQSNLGEDN